MLYRHGYNYYMQFWSKHEILSLYSYGYNVRAFWEALSIPTATINKLATYGIYINTYSYVFRLLVASYKAAPENYSYAQYIASYLLSAIANSVPMQ